MKTEEQWAEEDEPVAYINVEQRKLEWAKYTSWETPTVANLPKIPLYTHPQQRKPLTDEQIEEIADGYLVDYRIPAGCAWNFARDIEAAHGIKE